MASVPVLFYLVVMLVVANGAPILVRNVLGERGAFPVDGGRLGRDGRPFLGASKTWRGLASATLAAAVTGAILGLGFWFGAAFGALAMLGDLISSYLKRRRGLAPSDRATGIDQFPEAVLPLLLSHWWLNMGWWVVVAASVLFFILVTQLSPLLYRLGIRQRPH